MNLLEFNKQVERLKNTFGEKQFSDERIDRIWKAVGQFTQSWFRNIIDGMIDTMKFAPMPVDFYEPTSVERERLWKIEKEKNANEAKKFMSTYSAQDIGTICQAIVEKIKGRTSDADFESFARSLVELPKGKPCIHCDSSGYVFTKKDGYDFVARCWCIEGKNKAKGLPNYV